MIQIEASKQAEHEQSMHAVKREQEEMTGWGIVSVQDARHTANLKFNDIR